MDNKRMCRTVLMLLSINLLLCMAGNRPASAASDLYYQVLGTLENLFPDDSIQVSMGTAKARYDLGEPLEVRFLTSEDCYVHLMRITPDAKLIFLLPNPKKSAVRISGGHVYSTGTYPGAASDQEAAYAFGIEMTAAAPEGEEIINLLCSPEKIVLFDAASLKEDEPYYVIPSDDEERLQALLDRLEQFKQVKWSGTSVMVRIGPEPTPVPTPTSVPVPAGLSSKIKPLLKQAEEPPQESFMLAPESPVLEYRISGAIYPPIGSTGTTGQWFPPIGATGTTGKTEKVILE